MPYNSLLLGRTKVTTRQEFLDTAYEVANDPAIFDPITAELTSDYRAKVVAAPTNLVWHTLDHVEENQKLALFSAAIVDELLQRFTKSEVHTILAYAAVFDLPEAVMRQDNTNAYGLGIALASIGMLHLEGAQLAAEIADEQER
jgi:hypothetical protein